MNLKILLDELKKAIINKDYIFVDREKNRQSRYKYGLTFEDIEDLLYALNKYDLIKGPVPDLDFPEDEVFIFKKKMDISKTGCDAVFYIKVKYNDKIKILSCHEDERNDD